MSDQNKFHCNNKGRHFSDPGYKDVCEKQCDACAELYPQDSGYDKQLTPEEIIGGLGYMWHMGERLVRYDDAFKALNGYAAQQTAAKDEQIKELKGLCQREKNLREQAERIYNSEHVRIAELEKENQEMEESITALEAAKDEATEDRTKAQNERDQLLEKAEQLENKVKDLQEIGQKYSVFASKKMNALNKIKKERDQAFDLLERHTYTANTDERMGWLSEKITLLSSRENKKP